MKVSVSLILQVIAIVLFSLAAILGFGWLGAGGEGTKLLAVVALGLAFHAAAHL